MIFSGHCGGHRCSRERYRGYTRYQGCLPPFADQNPALRSTLPSIPHPEYPCRHLWGPLGKGKITYAKTTF